MRHLPELATRQVKHNLSYVNRNEITAIRNLDPSSHAAARRLPSSLMSLSPLAAAIAQTWPVRPWAEVTVLVGVSGGADSVALLRALHELRSEVPKPAGRLIVAHFHHATRVSARNDADFVRQLAQDLQLPFVLGERDTLPPHNAPEDPAGVAESPAEELLRDARYAFFRQAACEHGARFMALAHTADDQAETVLQRVIRGTGLRGLAGIPFARELCSGVSVVRPLLQSTRSEVEAYLQSLRQPFREDPSNQDLSYTRNALRHALLPELAERYNPQIREALCRLSRQADEAHAALDELVESELESAAVFRTDDKGQVSVTVQKQSLASLPDYCLRHLFVRVWDQCGWPQQAMGEREWQRLADRARQSVSAGQETSEHLPGKILLSICGDVLILRAD